MVIRGIEIFLFLAQSTEAKAPYVFQGPEADANEEEHIEYATLLAQDKRSEAALDHRCTLTYGNTKYVFTLLILQYSTASLSGKCC